MAPRQKKYSENDLRIALKKIFNDGWSVYKAAKAYGIPWSTLKDRLMVTPSPEEMPTLKCGRPFNLTAEEETKVVSYITKMQSIGFGLSATEVRRYAFQLAQSKAKNRFNKDKGIAGWDWWLSFKERYYLLNFHGNVSRYLSILKCFQIRFLNASPRESIYEQSGSFNQRKYG